MTELQNQQILDLQMQVTFQEDALNDLNEQMTALSLELQLAQKQIQLLSDKIKNNSVENENQKINMPANERPPHY